MELILKLLLLIYVSCQLKGVANVIILKHTPAAMFVFGDSYADTGNRPPPNDSSWDPPYGQTWPGVPSGRYSDGRVLTDFIGNMVKLPSAVMSYRDLEHGNLSYLGSGIDFSFAGSGVFYTFGPEYPTFRTQIQQFKGTVQKNSILKAKLRPCLAVLVYAGNDYIKYAEDHRPKEVLRLTLNVTREIAYNIQTLYKTGIRNFIVPNMQPAGCLPILTRGNGFKTCNVTGNLLSETHNFRLSLRLRGLQIKLPDAQIMMPDHFSIFTTILSFGDLFGLSKTLEPCCLPNDGYTCGGVDADGEPTYKLCKNPKSAFFWDTLHPTNAAWRLITAHYPPILLR